MIRKIIILGLLYSCILLIISIASDKNRFVMSVNAQDNAAELIYFLLPCPLCNQPLWQCTCDAIEVYGNRQCWCGECAEYFNCSDGHTCPSHLDPFGNNASSWCTCPICYAVYDCSTWHQCASGPYVPEFPTGGGSAPGTDQNVDNTEIDVTIDKSYCKTGDEYSLNVTVTGPNSTVTKYEIYLSRPGASGKIWDEYTVNKTFSYSSNAYASGLHTFEVTVFYIWNNTSKTIGKSVLMDASFPGREEIWSQISGQAEGLWGSTIAYADANPGKLKEYGICSSVYTDYYNSWDNDTREGQDVSCGDLADVDLDGNDVRAMLNNGGKYKVGDFHTHPPLTHCTSIFRTPGPSSLDLSGVNDLPRFVFDYDLSPVNAGHSLYANHIRYDYGQNERTQN